MLARTRRRGALFTARCAPRDQDAPTAWRKIGEARRSRRGRPFRRAKQPPPGVYFLLSGVGLVDFLCFFLKALGWAGPDFKYTSILCRYSSSHAFRHAPHEGDFPPRVTRKEPVGAEVLKLTLRCSTPPGSTSREVHGGLCGVVCVELVSRWPRANARMQAAQQLYLSSKGVAHQGIVRVVLKEGVPTKESAYQEGGILLTQIGGSHGNDTASNITRLLVLFVFRFRSLCFTSRFSSR